MKSELTVRTGAGAGSGAGSGAGNGAGSGAGGWIWRLEQELEWQQELDLEAGVEAEAEGAKSSEIAPWEAQIRILGPNSGDEKMATFKTRKMTTSPGPTGHTIPAFHCRFTMKSLF